MNALSIAWLDEASLAFPALSTALGADSPAPGLLAAGGDLRVERLQLAYAQGVFPWFSRGQPILWWSPDPRMVLPTAEFRLHRSLRKSLQRFILTPGCELRVDSAFDRVIAHCAGVERPGQDGTWIVPEMVDAYRRWHALGGVHSFETWVDGELVGGLYGIALGRMFFGESMFSLRTDASKTALAGLVAFCRHHRIAMIDCQQRTGHLASLGGREIARSTFLTHVRDAVAQQPVDDWVYHQSMWAELGLRPRSVATPA